MRLARISLPRHRHQNANLPFQLSLTRFPSTDTFSQQHGENLNLLLTRYALERWLYRLWV